MRFHLVGVTPLQPSPVMEGRKVEGKRFWGKMLQRGTFEDSSGEEYSEGLFRMTIYVNLPDKICQ